MIVTMLSQIVWGHIFSPSLFTKSRQKLSKKAKVNFQVNYYIGSDESGSVDMGITLSNLVFYVKNANYHVSAAEIWPARATRQKSKKCLDISSQTGFD